MEECYRYFLFFIVFHICYEQHFFFTELATNLDKSKLGARCTKHEDILIFLLCFNVENRLGFSTRARKELVRECLIKVGERSFCYNRKIEISQIRLCACRCLVKLVSA